MKTRDILIIVVIAALVSVAGYIAFKFIQTIPSAIELHNAVKDVNKPSQEEIDSIQKQRNEAQETFNTLLD
jgi:hypothetical protein